MESSVVAQAAQQSITEGTLFTLLLFAFGVVSQILMFAYLAAKAPNKAQRSAIRAEHDARERQSSMRAAG